MTKAQQTSFAKSLGYKSLKHFYKANPSDSDFQSNHPMAAKQMGMGGNIGSTVGGAIGTALMPGLGTAIGSTLGGLAGNLVEGAVQKSNNNKLLNRTSISPVVNINPYGNMGKGGKHWIQGAIKNPGRCSNPGDSRCPKGSPQYNLAMTFKKHHGFHKHDIGGITDPVVDQQMSSVIDVERNEMRVGQDGQGRSVIKEQYKNPNKFKPHAKNPMHEPIGNFVEAPGGDIIISKDMTNMYRQGDDITRKSIERKLVQRQMKEKPEQLGMQRSKKGGIVVNNYAMGGINDPFGNDNMLWTGDPYSYQSQNGSSNIPPEQFYNPQGDYFGSKLPQQRQQDEIPHMNKGPINPIGGPSYSPDLTSPSLRTVNQSPLPSSEDLTNPNWERIAPIAADAYQFFGALGYDRPNRLHNKGNGIARQNLNALETNVNIEPQLQQLNRGKTAQLSTIRDMNAGSNVQNAQNNQVWANVLGKQNDLMGMKVNRQQDLRNAKRQAIAGFEQQAGAEDAQYQGIYDQEKAQNKAAAQNIRNASVADVGSKVSQFGSEDKYFNIIKDSLKDYFDFSKFDKSNFSGAFVDNPDLVKHVMESVQFQSLDDADKWKLYQTLTTK